MGRSKKLAALFLIVCMVALSVGCGGKGDSTVLDKGEQADAGASEGAGEQQEDVTIDIYQVKVEIVPALEKVIDIYEAENPHVKINLETVGGGGDYDGTLMVKMNSSDQPDIVTLGGPQAIKDWEDSLVDLSDEPWVEHAAEGVLDSGMRNGKLYGLPTGVEGYGLVYNKRIFEKAGIDASKLTDFTSIEEAVKKLDQMIQAGELAEDFPNLEAVFEYPAKETWVVGEHSLNPYITAELGDAVETLDVASIEFKFADAYKKILDLQTSYTSSGEDRSKLLAVDYSTQLGSGLAVERVAMIQQGNWISPEVSNVDPELLEDLGMLPLPVVGAEEDCISMGIPFYWCVNKNSDEATQKAAKEFLNWLYQSDEGKELVVNDLMMIPPFTNYEGLEAKDALSKEVQRYVNDGKAIAWTLRSWPANWGMGTVGANVQQYLSGTMTWDQVVADSIEKWEQERN